MRSPRCHCAVRTNAYHPGVPRTRMDKGYLEARLVIPEAKMEEFLAFCSAALGTMPAVSRVKYTPDAPKVVARYENGTNGTRKRSAR